jgi:hypothetical protein
VEDEEAGEEEETEESAGEEFGSGGDDVRVDVHEVAEEGKG